jgi:PKD repeat protein
MAVSQLDPDKVLIGGLNLWVSHDACATYEGVGGYFGGIDYFHVDQQEYRIYKTSPTTEEIWFSNDGGIGHSTDFMASHDNLNRGIDAVNLWGYDQGWSEDIMVGGRYHNGNMAYHENYPAGEFLALGGGEAATGYVNYTDQNETFFSDIGGKVLPESLSGTPTNQSLNMSPNESYWNNGSSRIMFDNSYFNIAWLGNQNALYRSTDGGSSYEPMHVFGTNPDNDVLWIEQSYANQDFMYLHQAVGNTSVMWKSIDHGATWSSMNIPLNLRNMNFTLSGDDEYTLWVSYFDGQNGQKVYKTTNGGVSWTNITTATLNGQEPWAICHQYGTNGGVYLAMLNGLVYYRNNDMADWVSYSFGLPASSQPLRIVPFYKGGVIRLATWNLGVWEAPLYETSNMIAEFAAEFNTFFCPGNPVHFVDHSVASPNATYQWTFPGATPSTSSEKNPVVSYALEGTYDATLTVTDNGNSQTVTKTAYIQSLQGSSSSLSEDFEPGSFPLNWQRVGNGSWDVTDAASAYGTGTHSIRFDNYYYDAQGARDEFWTDKITASPQTTITFDAAYAQYNSGYSDTLAVLVSFNCGADWTEVFVRGGTALGNATPTTNYYTPAVTEWVNYSAPIPNAPSAGMDMVVAFQNRGHYGNPIYVDNINIASTSSVEHESVKPQLLAYPNPTSDILNLSGSMLNEAISQLRVYNGVGQLILEEKIRVAGVRMEKRLDTSNWPAGQYTIQFINGDQTIQESVIKK